MSILAALVLDASLTPVQIASAVGDPLDLRLLPISPGVRDAFANTAKWGTPEQSTSDGTAALLHMLVVYPDGKPVFPDLDAVTKAHRTAPIGSPLLTLGEKCVAHFGAAMEAAKTGPKA